MIRQVFDYPPMIDEIDAVFHVKGQPVLFAWEDRLYNPMRTPVGTELEKHEEEHFKQHKAFPGGVEAWWRKYLVDIEFRLAQEIPAHRAEYLAMLDKYGDVRNNRRRFLSRVALRLAAPLYGKMITVAEAKKVIAA
jgi:hypothetical protein